MELDGSAVVSSDTPTASDEAIVDDNEAKLEDATVDVSGSLVSAAADEAAFVVDGTGSDDAVELS